MRLSQPVFSGINFDKGATYAQDVCEVNVKHLASQEKLVFLWNWIEVDKASYLFWLSLCGPKAEAENYHYTLKITNAEDFGVGRRRYLFEGTTYCLPCDLTHEQMRLGKSAGILIRKDIVERATSGDESLLIFSLEINVAK